MNKYCCTLLLLISLNAKSQYKNLVFEGGGIRGVAYAGAVTALEEKKVLPGIEKVAGTSAGSIIALMIGLGYTAKEIDSMMTDLKIQSFNDGKGGLIGKYARLKKFYGIHRGREFEKWLEHLVENKLQNKEASFADLRNRINSHHQDIHSNVVFNLKDFYCVGTNLSRQQAEIFSFETTPDMPLKTAVRISCSIPLFYEPVLLDSNGREVKNPVKGYHYQVYADGGIMANYPINIFDSCKNGGNPLFCDGVQHNYQTLGIKLDRDEQIEQLSHSTDITGYQISNLNDYMGAFVNIVMETMNRRPNLENEKDRTIYIGYGNILSKPRKMKPSEKKQLFESGKTAVEHFLNK